MVKKKKIAFVLRTVGLEYDDRVRKEALALSSKHEVFIYVNFADNRKEEGFTSYGIPYKSFRLYSRDKLPSSKFLLIKAFEFYWVVKKYLKTFDLVWAHEEYAFMFPLFLRKNMSIWDLHEIPFRFQRKFMKPVFEFIEKKCIKIIHANKYRIEYLIQEGLIKAPEKHIHINNFPDQKFMLSNNIDEGFLKFKNWLNNSKYAYLQGLTTKARYPYNSMKAIMETKEVKAVVVGEVDDFDFNLIHKEYGDELFNKIYFTGMLEQLVITQYLQSADLSIILYEKLNPNNKYCEPNRLYQSIVLNVPVIVGSNPPMRKIVELNKFGLVINSDGNDLKEVKDAVNYLSANRNTFKKNLNNSSSNFLWNDKAIHQILNLE